MCTTKVLTRGAGIYTTKVLTRGAARYTLIRSCRMFQNTGEASLILTEKLLLSRSAAQYPMLPSSKHLFLS